MYAATGCAVKAPKTYALPEDALVADIEFDYLWKSIVETAGDIGFPVQALERESGFIKTERMGLPRANAVAWVDCGTDLLGRPWTEGVPIQASISFVAREEAAGGIFLRVRIHPQYIGEMAVKGCESMGRGEATIAEQVIERAKQLQMQGTR